MDAGVSPAKSILEKPLVQLTEEDISQLTREDCRKFLKEKGMRRPSWNKSQAIQQVLSLKALFEPGDDSGAGVLRKILVSQPESSPRVTSISVEPTKDSGSGARIPSPEDDNSQSQGKDSPRSAAFSGGSGQCLAEKDGYRITSPRSPSERNAVVGQLTIFYCGKVNVFDGVPPEKAKSIMRFAANPIDLPANDLFGGNTALCSFSSPTDNCSLFAPTDAFSKTMNIEKIVELPQYCPERANANRDPDVEGQANRKVSLQRYLEKRKDRGRFAKGKRAPGVTSSSLEMYLDQQTQLNTSCGQSNFGSAASPPQPALPHHNLCGSPENQRKNDIFSVDLNNEEIEKASELKMHFNRS